jgi:hypothetical protein
MCYYVKNLDDIVLGEIGQSAMNKYYMNLCMQVTKEIKFIETESEMVVAKGWGMGRMESCP